MALVELQTRATRVLGAPSEHKTSLHETVLFGLEALLFQPASYPINCGALHQLRTPLTAGHVPHKHNVPYVRPQISPLRSTI